MLNKKAIAAFAAAATLVSGLALAVPALAESSGNSGNNFQAKFEANKLYVNALNGYGPDGKTKKTYTEQELKDLKAIATSKDPEATKKQIDERKTAEHAKAFHDKFEANKAYVNALEGKDPDGNPKTYTEQELKDLKAIATSKDPEATKKPIEHAKAFQAKFEANKAYVNALNGYGPDGKTKKTYTEQELKDLKAIATSKDPEAAKKQIDDAHAKAFQAKFEANKLYVNALNGYGPDGKTKKTYTEQELKDLKAIATSKDPEATKKQIEERKAIEALVQKAEKFGLPKNVIESLKDYAKSKDVAAVEKLLKQGEKNALEEVVQKALAKGLSNEVVEKIRNSESLTAANAVLAAAEKNVNPVTPKPVTPSVTPSVTPTPSTPSVTTPSASTPAGASQSAPAAGVPAAPASVADLLPALKGMITAGANNVVVAGAVNRVTLSISNQAFLDRLNRDGSAKAYAFIYSSPRLLKGADGANYVTVRLVNGKPQFDAMFPAGYSGKHTVVLVDEQGNQLGWTNITVKSGVSGLPNSGVGVALTALAASVLAGAGAAFRKIRR
ncbi:hypothetical protein CGSMWGv00703Bmash_00085 [Gardnerella pickettii 00703Bmash]|uniref:hypothetical protein n=1 Tax=Gardnerella pickettii TaxID=2914924 RepID=UPI0002634979|nr:hypothetical protein [Gardnerella pickettii]EIK84432.1 hypothetical protein CGSMWGv00703Bmash_00085 [Gardnerella pickettii 00703Bmash]